MKESNRQEPIRFSRILRAQPAPTTASFIVRILRDASGEVTGVIERVATGQKERFEGCEAVGAVISRMLAREDGDQ